MAHTLRAQPAPIANVRAALVRAVIDDKLSGMAIPKIAAKHGISTRTVYSYLKAFQNPEAVKSAVESGNYNSTAGTVQSTATAYKQRIKEYSIDALEAGLLDPKDNYKRAGIAVQVMRGIGEFQDSAPTTNGITINISTLSGIPRCPDNLRGTFDITPNTPPPAAHALPAALNSDSDSDSTKGK